MFIFICVQLYVEITLRSVNCVNNGGKINDILQFSSCVVPCPAVQISGTHISLHTHWTWCYMCTSQISLQVYSADLYITECAKGPVELTEQSLTFVVAIRANIGPFNLQSSDCVWGGTLVNSSSRKGLL